MKFNLRYPYSNNDLTSFRYAQCAEFILQYAEFAARLDENFQNVKCHLTVFMHIAKNPLWLE